MTQTCLSNDSVFWYMSDITSRIIAETGIPTDRFHLGKIILQCFKDDPSFVLQIDGATGESETFKSVAERSVRCAISMRNFGLYQGDVMVLMAPNHLDLGIPFYAALYLGVAIATMDTTLKTNELQTSFSYTNPKIIFCQNEKASDVQMVLNQLNSDALIVTFDKGDHFLSLAEFVEKYGDDTPVDKFKPADFDSEEAIAFLMATSGTTGTPKTAAITHKNFAIAVPYAWISKYDFPSPTRMALLLAPLQWLTGHIIFIHSPIFRYTRLQTSQPVTQEHAYDLINTYKPTHTVISPTMLTTLIKSGDRDRCDFTSFDLIHLGGSAVPQDLIEEFQQLSPYTVVKNTYGMTEICGYGLYSDFPMPGSSGQPVGCLRYRLVDPETGKDISKPNIPGELWMKGPTVFKEYYNNPESTREILTEDGWYKTGDLFYRDDKWNFFFVERIKSLLKYKSYQISPVEIEGVIRRHPGVMDVGVSAVPDPECGDLVVACIVRRAGSNVTAQEIKDWIAESLTDSKRLRGGVIFIDALPMMATTKINRKRLQEMVMTMDRE